MDNQKLSVYGARAHNLQNIDLVLPHGKLIVITGTLSCPMASSS